MNKEIITAEMSKLSKLLKKIEELKEVKFRQNEILRAQPYLKPSYYKRRLHNLDKQERKLQLLTNA